jgi:hypothetical protein
VETLMHGFELEARSGDIPVDYKQSTAKHLFGTGKASLVPLKGEVLFKYIDSTGVGCRRNYMDVRISAADTFVDSTSWYGLRHIDIDSRSKDLTNTECIYYLGTH